MSWLQRRANPERWYRLHLESFEAMDAGKLDGGKAFERRVKATHGLIACGKDAIPFALQMLASGDAEIREDGAGVLGALGRDSAVVDACITALESEQDLQARDSIIVALGRLGDKRAVPSLALLIRSESTDGDTRFTAAQSLGRLVRRRFDQESDAVEAATAWLANHGY